MPISKYIECERKRGVQRIHIDICRKKCKNQCEVFHLWEVENIRVEDYQDEPAKCQADAEKGPQLS